MQKNGPAASQLIESPRYPWRHTRRSPWKLESMSPSLPSIEKESVGQMICLQGLFHKTIHVVILCGKFEASSMIKYSERWVEFKICFKILFMGLLKMDPDPEGPHDASGPEPGGEDRPPSGTAGSGLHVCFSPVLQALLSCWSGFPFFHCATFFFFSHLFSSCR